MDAAERQAIQDLVAAAAVLRRVADNWDSAAQLIREHGLDARSAQAVADARHLLTAEQNPPR